MFYTSCEKENLNIGDCDHLKQALILNDKEQVKSEIDYLLGLYTEDNINSLAETISTNCGIETNVFCFDCVYTLPSMSEIGFSFTDSDSSYHKVLDISYDSGNRMVISNIHD